MLKRRLKGLAKTGLRSILLLLFVLHLSFVPIYGAGGPNAQQEEQRQALGSLSVEGDVFVNSAVTAAESTVFVGDVLRTGGTGAATFTVTDSGSLRVAPNSEIVFAGQPQYAAELKLGKVVMNSLNAPMGITLRAGSSVVVAVAEGEQSTSSIEAPSDGSFLITCLGGSVGVVPLQGGKGIFITRGQSVSISPQGELTAVSSSATPTTPTFAAATPAATSTGPEPAARKRHSHLRWILIGAGVAGAGAVAAILSANGSGGSASPAVSAGSPSSSTSSSAAPSDPAPSPPTPSPAPPQPTPPQPNPPPQPPGCPQHHHNKNCQQNVVIGFSLHF
jgi:fructose-specific component phosphotransferase system IIB-like protein